MYFLFAEQNPLMMAFETNVANWIILVIALVFLWMKMVPPMFRQREEAIQRLMDEATRTREEGTRFFEEQNKRIANAEKEAEKILEEAKKIATSMQADIREQSKKEAEDTVRKIEQAIAAERTMAITELRAQAATAAVQLAELSLKGAITRSAEERLMSQFVEQLDTVETETANGHGRN